jgi:uncharacterized membrane protein
VVTGLGLLRGVTGCVLLSFFPICLISQSVQCYVLCVVCVVLVLLILILLVLVLVSQRKYRIEQNPYSVL